MENRQRRKRLTGLVAMSALTMLLSLTVAPGGVFAQSTAQISGTVTDRSGAVLPGVEVTATQTATGLARMAVTNETGSYVMPSLPVGPYRLEAALPGFRTYVQSGIVLQINANPIINAVLEVGQVDQRRGVGRAGQRVVVGFREADRQTGGHRGCTD